MPKIITTKEFRANLAQISNKAYADKEYVIVANTKTPDKSFVVININVFSALLKNTAFGAVSDILQNSLTEIAIKTKEKYSKMSREK